MRSIAGIVATLLVSLSTPATADWPACIKGDFPERIEACTKILQSSPSELAALANRGMTYREIGEYERAIADLGEVILLDPKVAGMYLELGLALDGKGDHRLAIILFGEALRRDSSLLVAWFGRAMAYEDAGRIELSVAHLNEAMRRDRPMVAALYRERGDVMRRAHQYDNAIAAYDRSIALVPGWPNAYFGRGAAYEAKGEQELAVADYLKCLEFPPTTEFVQRAQQMAREQLEKLNRR